MQTTSPLETTQEALNRIEKAVQRLLKETPVPPPPRFRDLLRKELVAVPSVNLSAGTIREEEINRLYELRAQLLDWTRETGFLGFFDRNPGRRYIYRRRLEVFLNVVPDLHGKRVLEIGCAAGITAALLAPRCREFIGTDVTSTAIDFAWKLNRELNNFNARFEVADAHALPFPDRSFDVIVSTETFEHFLHPEQALREFRRVLVTDGQIALTTTTAPTLSDAAVKVLRLFKRDLYVDTEEQFDKKAYQAAKVKQLNLPPEIFRRVHRRFGYNPLTRMFEDGGFRVQRAHGAVFAFPPVYLAFYQFLPRFFIPAVRWFEELLNELGLFKRFGSVSTAFLLLRK